MEKRTYRQRPQEGWGQTNESCRQNKSAAEEQPGKLQPCQTHPTGATAAETVALEWACTVTTGAAPPAGIPNTQARPWFLEIYGSQRQGIDSLLKVFLGGELRTQKLNFHLMRTQSVKVLPLKPWVGQYVAMPATLTARDFFFANFYPSGPFTCIFFPKTFPSFSRVSCG